MILIQEHVLIKQVLLLLNRSRQTLEAGDPVPALFLCHNQIQGTYAGKQENCLDCAFYFQVRGEQGSANIRTKFLKFVHPFAASPILNHLEPVQIPGGTRFITQGTRTSTGYIIQQGACLELLENKHGLHPVGHRSDGDISGMIPLLTE